MAIADGPSDDAHEAMCRRCGVSCHLAIPVNGVPITVPGLHCRFLREGRRGEFACTVYDERFARAPWCHHAAQAAPLGYLARDCPYALAGGWRHGKVKPGRALMRTTWPAIRAEIVRTGLPDWIDEQAFLRAMRVELGEAEVSIRAWPGRPGRRQVVFGGRHEV